MTPEFPKYVFIDDASLSRQKPENVVRSEMDAGPAKVRPISKHPVYTYEFSISFNVKNFSDFLLWLQDDLNEQTNWFLMKDPFSGKVKRFRIVEIDDFRKSSTLVHSSMRVETYHELQ